MLELPQYIPLVFILTTLATFVLFIFSVLLSDDERVKRRAHMLSLVLLLWIVFQSTLSLNAWYMDRKSVPPHMAFPLITTGVILLLLFVIPRGRKFIDGLSLPVLTWIHIVRVPVELCLWWLAAQKQVPWSITLEGFNFDIVFGITAPVVALLYFTWKKISRSVLLVWNILGLVSVLAVVVRAAGALPGPTQVWDFSQPNYAMTHFPFIWLPSFIVPVVLLAHFTAIRRLTRKAAPPESVRIDAGQADNHQKR